MSTGVKYKGTATFFRFLWSGGTTVLSTESREFEVQQQAQRVDVTVRGDTAKAYQADLPEITLTMGGLDTSGTPAWYPIPIGEAGTIEWGREGTVAGRTKESMPAILQNKNYASPYDGVATWGLEFASNGGSITQGVWA